MTYMSSLWTLKTNDLSYKGRAALAASNTIVSQSAYLVDLTKLIFAALYMTWLTKNEIKKMLAELDISMFCCNLSEDYQIFCSKEHVANSTFI